MFDLGPSTIRLLPKPMPLMLLPSAPSSGRRGVTKHALIDGDAFWDLARDFLRRVASARALDTTRHGLYVDLKWLAAMLGSPKLRTTQHSIRSTSTARFYLEQGFAEFTFNQIHQNRRDLALALANAKVAASAAILQNAASVSSL